MHFNCKIQNINVVNLILIYDHIGETAVLLNSALEIKFCRKICVFLIFLNKTDFALKNDLHQKKKENLVISQMKFI